MSRVVEHLAQLTGFRDRDALDVTLVAALNDLVRPAAVAIYRAVGEAGQERWFTRARLAAGEATASADPLWVELDSLPPLAARPERLACLREQQVMALPGPPALTLFPLSTELETVGVLEIESAQPLSADDQRLVLSILRVVRNFQSLLDYSERDMLTGLLNRKTFDECFMRNAMPSAARPAPPDEAGGRRVAALTGSWLAVVDIDHFKKVNDTYGHLIGDEVLLLLSRLMRSTFRFHDLLYRFGGEEFVALIRCENAWAAAVAFERLRVNVQRHVFPQVGHITVSVGFTQVRAGDTPSAAFGRADKAIYHAKQTGRNQVADHAALVLAGLLQDEARDSDIELF